MQWITPEEWRLAQWLGQFRGNFYPYSRVQQCRLALLALANPARSDRFKEELPKRWKDDLRASNADEKQDLFDYLADAVKRRRAVGQRIASIKLLAVLAPFTPDQGKELRSILAAIKDVSVAQALRGLLGEAGAK